MTDNTSPVESFFSGLFVDFWRKAMPDEVTQKEVAFLEAELGLAPSARVLDVPCGTARHSLALAGRGYQMTAVDLSSQSIEQARELAVQQNVSIGFEHRDMADLPWPASFDAAFSMGNSFGYSSDEHDRAFLGAVARVLKPGGRFALDYGAVAEALFPHFQERTWMPVGDMLFLREGRCDAMAGRVESKYTLIGDGRTESKQWSQRVYTCRQVLDLLSAAGFSAIHAYGSLTKEPFKLGSRQLIIVATKAG